MTLFDRNTHHATAPRLHDVATDDGVNGPVGAFDQNIWLNRHDQIVRRFLVEDHDGVHARQRLEDLGALGLRGERSIGPLDVTDGSVGIQADDQRVAKPARVLKIAQMTDVEQVEHTVGEDNRPPRGPKALDEGDGVAASVHLCTISSGSAWH